MLCAPILELFLILLDFELLLELLDKLILLHNLLISFFKTLHQCHIIFFHSLEGVLKIFIILL